MLHLSRSVMSRCASQINRISLPMTALLLSAILYCAFPGQAYAKSRTVSEVHKVSFDSAAYERALTLDWRRPEAALQFQIPDNDWVDSVELLITMRPNGQVRSDAPIRVKFNDGPFVPIQSEGHGFDARLTLDPSRLKGQRNQIIVGYQIPPGEACLGPAHGSWDIDVSSSYVVVKSRPKSRALGFHDVKTALKMPAAAPKTVAVLAKGSQALQYEVLAAQGLALNMDTLPNFKTKRGAADLEIVAATRDSLSPWVRDKSILRSQGSQIAIAKSGVTQIVLTGDTDAQVLSAVKAFAAFSLPSSRSTQLTPDRYGRVDIAPVAQGHFLGKRPLTAMGAAPFSLDWAPRAQHIQFNVADPAASSGVLTLDAKTGPFVAPSSVLNATLNGKVLGQLSLAKHSNHAKIDIPRGLLRGLDNHLVLTPNLEPSEAQPTCAGTRMGPGFVLGEKSTLEIVSEGTPSDINLSRFAASGAPFSNDRGRNVTISISGQNMAEKNAALKIMAKLGQASGHAWSDASFVSRAENIANIPGNILFVSSKKTLEMAQLSGAPKGLKVAIGGTAHQKPVSTRTAAYDPNRINLMSTRQSVRGGVAAVYRDPLRSERVIGVITQTQGQSFARAAESLTHNDLWNDLAGSVSRWNDVQVMMAQTAVNVPVRAKPQSSPLSNITSKISMPDTGAWGEAAGRHWRIVQKTARHWVQKGKVFIAELKSQNGDSPIAVQSVPALTMPQAIKPEAAVIPIPSLKRPTRTMQPNARVEAPRRDQVPVKLEAALNVKKLVQPKSQPSRFAPIQARISDTYAAATGWVTQRVARTDLGQNRIAEKSGLGLLVMALIVMGMLIALVFISPTQAGVKSPRR